MEAAASSTRRTAACRGYRATAFGDDIMPDLFPPHAIRVFATDGDTKRRVMMHDRFWTTAVNREVGGTALPGADLPAARTAQGFDVGFFNWLHMIKRFRNALLRTEGVKANGKLFDVEWLRTMLDEADCPNTGLLTDGTDKMNVRSAVDLLRALELAAQKAANDLRMPSTTSDNNLKEQLGLRLLGLVVQPYLAVILPDRYIETSASLGVSQPVLQLQCVKFAASATAAAVLSHLGIAYTEFLPAVLFHDLQHNAMMVLHLCIRIHSCLSCESNRQATVSLATLDTNACEDTFSTICGAIYDPSCDAMQFATRITAAMDVARMFETHPKWARHHRRALDNSGDGITLARLGDALKRVNATLIISSDDVKLNRFQPTSAWQQGVGSVLALLRMHSRHINSRASVLSPRSENQLVLQLPAFMHCEDGSVVGICRHEPSRPDTSEGIEALKKALENELELLQQSIEAETADTGYFEALGVAASSADEVYELDEAADNVGGLGNLMRTDFCDLDGRRVLKSNLIDTMFDTACQPTGFCAFKIAH